MQKDGSNHLNYIILPIDGMTCASCSARIQKNLSALDWVETVDVSLAAEQAAIGFVGPIKKAIELKQNIIDSGYRVRTRTSEILIPGFNDPTKISYLQKELEKITGLESAHFNAANETLTLEHIPGIVSVPEVEQTVSRITGVTIVWRDSVSYGDEQFEKERLKRVRKQSQNAITSIVFACAVFMLTMPHLFNFVTIIPGILRFFIAFILTSWVVFVAGSEIFEGFVRKLKPGKSDMNTLVSLGAGAAWTYSTVIVLGRLWLPEVFTFYPVFFDSAAFIIGFILLGRSLEARARRRTGLALNSLIKLQPEHAIKIVNNENKKVSVKSLSINDECLVKNGERIPVDGVLVSEVAEIDESMLSGESLPLLKQKGQLLLAGTTNSGGELIIRVLKIGSETALGQIVQWVRKAQNSQPPVQKFVDKIAAVFVPSVILIAVLTLIIWLLSGSQISMSLMHFINVIVIACPCALGLATPTAIIVSMGMAAKNGILIKDAAVLENLLKIDTVLFDKTGTLTNGKMAFNSITLLNGEENHNIQLAASLENHSSHPIARAIMEEAERRDILLLKSDHVEMLTGFGIRATIKDQVTGVGNRKLMQAMSVAFTEKADKKISELISAEKILIYLAQKNDLLAVITLNDSVRDEAPGIIKTLEKKKIATAMVTGDGQKTAQIIADKLGIQTIFAEQPPQVKGSVVNQLQKEGRKVAMLGDGINDAVALTRADVGIALAEGTDVAVDAADIVFLKPDLNLILTVLNLTKRTERTIKQNLIWAFGYNLIMLPSAAGILYLLFGIAFNPAFAALAMAMSSVSVVLNSLRLKRA